jgi:hypothetical protein
MNSFQSYLARLESEEEHKVKEEEHKVKEEDARRKNFSDKRRNLLKICLNLENTIKPTDEAIRITNCNYRANFREDPVYRELSRVEPELETQLQMQIKFVSILGQRYVRSAMNYVKMLKTQIEQRRMPQQVYEELSKLDANQIYKNYIPFIIKKSEQVAKS